MTRPIIAITVGDPCGIGPEITAKALALAEIYERCRPLVVGDAGLMCEAARIAGVKLEVRPVEHPAQGRYEYGVMDVLDLQNVDLSRLEYGKVTSLGGEASFQYIAKAIELALAGEVDAVTTGPIHKEAINLAGHHYAGHTEIFADLTKTKDYCMMLIDKNFRVSHVTTHVALSQVPSLVTKERVLKVIELTHEALLRMGIAQPRIAVSGLNPHAGDGGLFGREEIEEIGPAVEEACRKGMAVDGPLSPDTVFVKLQGGQYDAVVAMYHDQGHIPTKIVGFRYDNATGTWGSVAGINVTLGLPIIRTSVDHGTAFGKAGKGTANPESMVDAIKLAADLACGGRPAD
ncbi:MAG: 4-hydroxythreonine-4-phosphate dehydrogenase PdxA [Thermoanaerobacteraceae bacterium]|uniref:4-hydroxythreonine-4-phosphate dehydrogenase PdxA n=1 Tax=Thermanaeromonas sp. C210 TaxID=2731925 RepID=UPI00155C9A37|nr:4-hydroxythreonine-4-phosphate dehydrogenase PdxA [Thermanaeromonas sp. C210]MBE3580850.1 4-hydroxythreonine-4-phosphate dehydrogenase PdxA [Thermoanaerobacteraceae bacterium]GFN21702.1 4-hydroxythreonine-4-phosphate dehydrogenase [Thermanaeromonas sp. C210]